jgi:hypothetical protein
MWTGWRRRNLKVRERGTQPICRQRDFQMFVSGLCTPTTWQMVVGM